MTGIPFDALLKGLAAASAATLGVLVMWVAPRKGPWPLLGVFLLLIAGNQAIESAHAFPAWSHAPWRGVAALFAALDPLFLYLFLARYPAPNALGAPWRVRAVLAASLVFGAAAFAMERWATYLAQPLDLSAMSVAHILSGLTLPLGLSLFTAVVYTAGLVRATSMLARDPASPTWRLLHAATCVAALPVWTQVLHKLHAFPTTLLQREGWTFLPLYQKSVVTGVIVVVLLAGWLLSRRAARAGGWAALRPGLLLATGLSALVVADVLLGEVARLGRASAALRWIVFGLLVSPLLLRHEAPAIHPAARRRAARVLVGLGVLAPAFVALVVVAQASGEAAFTLRPFDWAILAALLVGSQGFRRLVDHVAAAAYGLPAHEDAPGGPLGPGARVSGRYRIVRLLGVGGGGRAFLARDELLGRDVALKEILHDGANPREDALREARLASLVRHPRVVTVHDVLPHEDATLLVVEHVGGGSLADLLRERGPLGPREGRRMLVGVLEGLAAVHAAGVVHRDVKPENVLLDADGSPKIGDFGVARARRGVTARLGGADAFVGTLPYMAPEQRRGEVATPAADVYAVGVLATRALRAPLPPDVARVVARALLDEPSRRWASAGAMLEALRRAEGEEAAPDADEVPVAEGRAPAGGERLEVEVRPVAARGHVLQEEPVRAPDDAAVLGADVRVEVERHVRAPAAPDDPGAPAARTRRVERERAPLADALGEDETRPGGADGRDAARRRRGNGRLDGGT